MQLDEWICTWTGFLVHQVYSFASYIYILTGIHKFQMKYLENTTVFSRLNILIKNDPTFAKFILPHIILVLLIENDQSVIEDVSLFCYFFILNN